MEVRPLSFQSSDEIIIATTVEGGWVEVVGGERFVFPQFAQFRVSRQDGNFLLDRAENSKRCRDEQRTYERKEWARMISSLNQSTRDNALKFCDAEGNPRSPEMPVVPLVDLTTAKGQEIYKRAWERAKAEGKLDPRSKKELHTIQVVRGFDPDPDAGSLDIGESEKFRQEAYEENERVPRREELAAPPPPPVTAQARVEGDGEAPDRTVKVKKPSADWAEKDLLQFAQSKGFSLSKSDLKVEGKVLEVALRAHADHCKRLTAAGVPFEEV